MQFFASCKFGSQTVIDIGARCLAKCISLHFKWNISNFDPFARRLFVVVVLCIVGMLRNCDVFDTIKPPSTTTKMMWPILNEIESQCNSYFIIASIHSIANWMFFLVVLIQAWLLYIWTKRCFCHLVLDVFSAVIKIYNALNNLEAHHLKYQLCHML